MRICFVTHASNYHSRKWVGWFVSRGHEVHVISFAYEDLPGATVHSLASKVKTNDSDLKKLGYPDGRIIGIPNRSASRASHRPTLAEYLPPIRR